MKIETIDVNDSAPVTTHRRMVTGLVKSPKVESNRISNLSKTRRMIQATNSPVRAFIGSFRAFSQFASGKIIYLLGILFSHIIRHCFVHLRKKARLDPRAFIIDPVSYCFHFLIKFT